MFRQIACVAALLAMAPKLEAKEMEVGAQLQGFKVVSVTALPDIGGRLVRMTYEKNGADLVWLDRDDQNLTFGIGFKTLPEDDTGVPHIIEHSVLCGSEKYPVKEPFVDLMKSSMATFLNAVTWPDHTVYPVASANRQDLYNLADVYLDAVFHPLSMQRDLAFRQEGWHYEYNGTNLVRNGVVYSEMKGSFANPHSYAFRKLEGLLFPDTVYGRCSGGDPEQIPALTYEAYQQFYRRFYHPSNATIFLDGSVDLEAMLQLIGSYLKDYDRRDVAAKIDLQRPVAQTATLEYASDEVTNRTLYLQGWVFGTYADREKLLAANIISDVLAGSNESPLKKALIEAGLCEDVDFWASGAYQLSADLCINNTSPEKVAECRRVVQEVLTKAAREGLDHAQIYACLDELEFAAREKDSGTTPRGIINLFDMYDTWLYGGDPAETFRVQRLFDSLRKQVDAGAFERYLQEIFLENPHHCELVMNPSATLAAAQAQAYAEQLAKVRASMSDADFAQLLAGAKELKDHQEQPDDPQAVAKLPRLALKDVPIEGKQIVREIRENEGVAVIRPKVETQGIFYADLGFSLEGLTDEEIADASFLVELYGNLATANFKPLELKRELASKLGRFNVSCQGYESGAYVTVHVSALETRQDDALRLLMEVLLSTSFADSQAIATLRSQSLDSAVRAAASRGQELAQYRAESVFSERSRLNDCIAGIGQLRRLQSPVERDWAALAKKIFTRERLVVSVTDNLPCSFAQAVIGLWPSVPQEKPSGVAHRALGPLSEGYEIPAEISFAASVSKLPATVAYCGSQRVAEKILSLEYLWNDIRVKGGAYGAHFEVARTGEVKGWTYRDPNPARSLKSLTPQANAAALQAFLASGESFEKYQVATAKESYRSPRAEARRCFAMYLNHFTPEDLQQSRREVLATTREELARFAQELAGQREVSVCVIGGHNLIEACKLEKVEPVAARNP